MLGSHELNELETRGDESLQLMTLLIEQVALLGQPCRHEQQMTLRFIVVMQRHVIAFSLQTVGLKNLFNNVGRFSTISYMFTF